MSMKSLNNLPIELLLAALLLCIGAAVVVRTALMEPKTVKASTGATIPFHGSKEYEEGAEAYRAGVSANANPYTNWGVWLKGWIDAKNAGESK